MVRSRVTMPPSRSRSRDPRKRAVANIFFPWNRDPPCRPRSRARYAQRAESRKRDRFSLTVSLAWTENERLLRIAQFCRAWNLVRDSGFPGTPSRITRIANVAGNILGSGKELHHQRRHVRDVFRAEICFTRNVSWYLSSNVLERPARCFEIFGHATLFLRWSVDLPKCKKNVSWKKKKKISNTRVERCRRDANT